MIKELTEMRKLADTIEEEMEQYLDQMIESSKLDDVLRYASGYAQLQAIQEDMVEEHNSTSDTDPNFSVDEDNSDNEETTRPNKGNNNE